MQIEMKKAWIHSVFPQGLGYFSTVSEHPPPEEDKQNIWRPYCWAKLNSENYKIVIFI